DKGIGTGPYSLTAWEPGVRSAGKRNPNYFKEGKPYFDEVETLHVADVAARMSAIRSDEVDVIDEPDLKLVDRLQKSPGLVVHEAAGAKHFTYPMHMDKAPFDNVDVRLALKYAIDRKAILQTLLRGHGYLGNDHPIARNQKYYASELPQRAYDPDKAKFHLKKAGLESLDLTLYAGDIYAGGVDGALLYKEHAAKAGINMDVQRVSTDGYWSNVWNVKPFCVSFWSGRATEDLMFSTAFAADSAWNETKWNHERFNMLLVEARAELEETKRRAMYVEMQQIVRDIGGLVAPVFANWVFVTRDKLSVPEKIAGNWSVDGYKNTERWWFT
ncbi:MAG: ABC transporter substrate-binding protein, partial [Rhizobiales bacterium]|nr:ABC transporter substrate-binding protein [Hyphomicrobiales bacterium]